MGFICCIVVSDILVKQTDAAAKGKRIIDDSSVNHKLLAQGNITQTFITVSL